MAKNTANMKNYLVLLSLGLLMACNKPAQPSTSETGTAQESAGTIAEQPVAETPEAANMEQAPETPATDMKGWKTLEQDNYTIQYPADWDLNQDPTAASKFALLSPRESKKDQFMENVNLATEDLTGKGDIDLAYYASASQEQLYA